MTITFQPHILYRPPHQQTSSTTIHEEYCDSCCQKAYGRKQVGHFILSQKRGIALGHRQGPTGRSLGVLPTQGGDAGGMTSDSVMWRTESQCLWHLLTPSLFIDCQSVKRLTVSSTTVGARTIERSINHLRTGYFDKATRMFQKKQNLCRAATLSRVGLLFSCLY
jgi:hypothetical protein